MTSAPTNAEYAEYIICDSSDESDSGTPKPSTSNDQSKDQPEDQSEDQSLQTGIQNEAFEVLRTTSEICLRNGIPIWCGLLIGEIKMTQKYELYQEKMFGYTEGAGKSSQPEPTRMASKAVIFMVISLIENWKIPVGLFFVHDPDIKYFADIIEETLDKLLNVGVDIVSVTMNCLSPHFGFSLANELGAEIDVTQDPSTFKAYFQHPSKKNATVHIIYDVDIILPELKSYWSKSDVIFDKGYPIKHSFCEKIKKYEKPDCWSNTDYNWMILKKKLLYDENILGRTYADALTYLKGLGLQEFQGTGPTIQFIRVLYFISQVSEVNGLEGQIWIDMSQANEHQWKPDVTKTIEYFKNINRNREFPDNLSVFKKYTVGIMVYFISLYGMYNASIQPHYRTVPNRYRLPSILPSRFALKHVRLGILEKPKSGTELSALGIFKKIKTATKNLHPIDADKI
ncbi:unnamed protein product [Ceutorhynchus assimilis]|uniref:Transposable element P transposase-like RNase H domain-containing protein n=1 Tax=Ceutorhynchus assimilis TaxID=467358 RepID=A0A9N9MM23_9CUCU|nr:unnamed protein product [Ceutorhynchus assimilis]